MVSELCDDDRGINNKKNSKVEHLPIIAEVKRYHS